MSDKIKSTDTKSNIDFYSVGDSASHSADQAEADLNLEALKNRSSEPNLNQQTESATVKLNVSLFVWFLFFGALSFLLFNGYALATTVAEAYDSNPILALVMAISSLGFIGLLAYGIGREVLGFISLKKLGETLDLHHLRDHDTRELTIKNLERRAHSQRKSDIASSYNRRFFASVQPHHTNQELLDMYISNVEQPLLSRAEAIIKQEGVRSGGITFISPNEFIQTFALLWTNLRVMRLISQLYGIRPGAVGNIKLLGMMWQNVLLQNATDIMAEQLVKDISNKFLGTIAEKTGIAATSGALTVRLGYQLIKQVSLIYKRDNPPQKKKGADIND